jgi:hypothetical protein
MTTLDAEFNALNSCITTIHEFNRRVTGYNKALHEAKSADQLMERIDEELATLQTQFSAQTSELINTLEATNYLLDSGWSERSCPVCDQGISPDELRRIVADALASMKSARDFHDERRAASTAVDSTKQALKTEAQQLLSAASSLLERAATAQPDEVSGLQVDLSNIEPLLTSSDTPDDALQEWFVALDQITAIEPCVVAKCDERKRERDQLYTVQTGHKNYAEAIMESKRTDAIAKDREQDYKIVQKQRIEFIQEILEPVASEASRLYKSIHPKGSSRILVGDFSTV